MAKKNDIKSSPKKAIRQMVEKNLETLLVQLDPAMGISEEKFRKRIRRAGKMLAKGIRNKANAEKEKTTE